MRVVTLNLASGRDAAGRPVPEWALAEAVAGLDADVLSAQEVDVGQPRSHCADQPTLLAAALGAPDWRYAATVVGTPGPARDWRPVDPVVLRGPGEDAPVTRYGVALFSRLPVRRWHVLGLRAGHARLPLPIRDARTGSASLGWVPDEPRAAIAAELDGLTVIGTHLSFAPHTAARQLRRVRAWALALPGPTVLAGDLNLVGRLPELVTGGARLVRAPTYPAQGPRVQFDHLLSLGGLVGRDPDVRRLAVGDHRCVAATVRLIGASDG
jgi:endonuclease/exonuclease/phosphatase family metal-dependent hydrolase